MEIRPAALLLALAPLLGLSFAVIDRAEASDVGLVQYDYTGVGASTSKAYPGNDFAAQLAAARGDSVVGACDWGWGAGGSPFHSGTGDCDRWRVGPHWNASVGSVYMFRDNIDLATLATGATAGGVVIDPADAGTVSENMHEGIGARLMLSSEYPQCRGYELQISYLGIFNMQANAYNPDVPFAGPLPVPPGFVTSKALNYRSEIHSASINFQSVHDGPLKVFGGMSYVLLAEDVSDLLDASAQNPQIPPISGAMPPLPGDPTYDLTDILRGVSVDNNLIGLQGGMRTDFLSLGDRFRIEGFFSGGAYFNYIKRESQYTESRRTLRLDDPSTTVNETNIATTTTITGYEADRMRVAFVAEALLGGVYQFNPCTSARLGYQYIYLTGVELGNEAFIGASPTYGDLLMHGWTAGLEYRR